MHYSLLLPLLLVTSQVMHCTACNNSWKAPGYIRRNKEAPAPLKPTTAATATSSSNSGIKLSVSKQDLKSSVSAGDKRKFSFLNKIQGPSSAAQDNKKSSSASAKPESKDFMSFNAAPKSNLSESNANSLQSLSKGLFARGAPPGVSTNSSGSGTMTLLELEALHKKNKRKKLDQK